MGGEGDTGLYRLLLDDLLYYIFTRGSISVLVTHWKRIISSTGQADKHEVMHSL